MWNVMIIDDESIIRKGLKQYVQESHLPFQVSAEARNAEDALALMESIAPHVLFVDINLPEVNGLDLLRLIRCRYGEVVAVIVSGYDTFEYARQALQLHAYDYVLKPVPKSDLKRLLVRLDQHLSGLYPNLSEPPARAAYQETASHREDGSVLMVKVTDYINGHYQDPELTVSKVAALFHMNHTYLSKRMKQELGASFLEYVTELRLSKAKELLDHTMHNIKIGDLAIKVGYTNQYYFSRLFKNRIGMCPLEYKKQSGR
ncbi:response regulator transcription factor [Paenibacillus taiwanensis]|uniref:response regulator transcription factor n=1 Tax=Paenibacillus taiwanensis TaxID=401638 RepID=UPI00048E49F0|nr:response regulator [Paenibacillus taiwanensis]